MEDPKDKKNATDPTKDQKTTVESKGDVKIDGSMLKLRVLTHIPLPHILSYKGKKYIFDPDAIVPKDFGDALLKNQKGSFVFAKGKAVESEYTYRKKFQEKESADLFLSLTDDQKLKVIKFIDTMLEEEREKEKKE